MENPYQNPNNQIDVYKVNIIANQEAKGTHYDQTVELPFNLPYHQYKYCAISCDLFGFMFLQDINHKLTSRCVILTCDAKQINTFDTLKNNTSNIIHMSMLASHYTGDVQMINETNGWNEICPTFSLINESKRSIHDEIYVPVSSLFQRLTFSLRFPDMTKLNDPNGYWHAVISFKFFK